MKWRSKLFGNDALSRLAVGAEKSATLLLHHALNLGLANCAGDVLLAVNLQEFLKLACFVGLVLLFI